MRKCIWCGGPADSKEHVYPQWLRKFDAPSKYMTEHGSFQEPTPQLVTRFTEEDELVEYELTRGNRTPVLHEVQVKVVCRGCNSGWMSRMEKGIEPLVHALSRNGSKQWITQTEQRDLAVWAHKTFMMYDQFNDLGDRRYPVSEYLDFYENRTIQSDAYIFIARSNSPYAGFGMWNDSRTLIPVGVDGISYVRDRGKNCGSAYLAVDGLVIFEQWFASHYPEQDRTASNVKRAALRKMSSLGVQRIWPVQPAPLDWGRGRALGQRRTEQAMLALHGAMAPLSVLAKRVPRPG